MLVAAVAAAKMAEEMAALEVEATEVVKLELLVQMELSILAEVAVEFMRIIRGLEMQAALALSSSVT